MYNFNISHDFRDWIRICSLRVLQEFLSVYCLVSPIMRFMKYAGDDKNANHHIIASLLMAILYAVDGCVAPQVSYTSSKHQHSFAARIFHGQHWGVF